MKLKAFEAHNSCGHFAPKTIKKHKVRFKSYPPKTNARALILDLILEKKNRSWIWSVLVRRPYGQLRDLVALSQKKSPPKTRKHTSHGCPSERRKRRAASERRARGSSTSWRRTDRTRRLFFIIIIFSCEKKQLALKINALRKIAGLEIFRPEKLR